MEEMCRFTGQPLSASNGYQTGSNDYASAPQTSTLSLGRCGGASAISPVDQSRRYWDVVVEKAGRAKVGIRRENRWNDAESPVVGVSSTPCNASGCFSDAR